MNTYLYLRWFCRKSFDCKEVFNFKDYSVKKLFAISCILSGCLVLTAQKPVPVKPRILISTDIGGTDPDDNQSMIHFLMYSNLFNTEGLISSPSYGRGTKQHLLEMIALYEKDLPKLKNACQWFSCTQRFAGYL